MKPVYFVHRDAAAAERQSDGVELCVIPQLADGRIYFYCQSYAVFWRTLEEVGDFDKTCDFPPTITLRPATLVELAAAGLLASLDTVKQYDIANGRLSAITYIHLT
ncbi:hypothetical protein [Stenotrophomonas sp.]|uniref:hypothetical protein n=1 Tax=Stenotrophomonas sp. TaxID=69392 RepID=UPI002FCC05C5